MRPLAWAVWLLGFVPLLTLAAGTTHSLIAGERRTSRARWALVAALAAVVYFGWTLRDFSDPAAQYTWLGFDSAQYETEARTMLRERRLWVSSHGHEAKAGYVYYLASVHAIFGGNLFHVVYGQRLLLIAAALGVGGIARRIHGLRAAAYAAGFTLAATQLLGWSRALYPAIWASALAAVGVWMLIRVGETEDAIWSLGAGGLLALAVYSRPNLIVFVPFALVWLAWVLKESKHRRLLILSCLAGVCVVAAAFALRSFALYGQWSNLQENFIMTFLRGNPVPPGLDLTGIDSWGWANALRVPREIRPFLAFVVQRPLGFFALWGKKAIYQVGINFLNTPGLSGHFTYEVFYFNAAALVGGIVVWRRGWLREAWLPVAFVVLNMASITIVIADQHLFRMIVPNLVFLSVFAGAAAAALEEAWPWRRARIAHGLAATAFLTTLPFRYGLQYAVIGFVWMVGLVREPHRRRTTVRQVAQAVVNLPATSYPGKGTGRR
ncbi:glycosyltransferase family 39 protein [Nitrospinae bacterium AH_259_B05_G02_I21]|nr:glycosyltransferase family 39 protein [Nitrospinae bacterium AH_259_B05_G02_I21]